MMDKGVDFNFETYVGNLKKKLAMLQEDIEIAMKTKQSLQIQVTELEARKALVLEDNEVLLNTLQQAKAQKLENSLRSQQLNKELKQTNIEHLKMLDETTKKAAAMQTEIENAKEERKAIREEKQRLMKANDELRKRKDQLALTLARSQQQLERRMKEITGIAAVDNKRREVLAKVADALQS